MTQDQFHKEVYAIRDETGEPCDFLVGAGCAQCVCDGRATIWLDEIDEEDASEWIHDHAAH